MWVTDFADDGVFQHFGCLKIFGIDVFIEEVPKKEVQGTDIGLGWNVLTAQQAFLADVGVNRNDPSDLPGSF